MLMLVKVCVIPGFYGCYHRWWSHFPSMTRAFQSALGLISSVPLFFLLLHNHFSFLCLIDSIITQTCCFTFHLYEPRQSKWAKKQACKQRTTRQNTVWSTPPQHCLALFSPVLEQREETPPGNHLLFTCPHFVLNTAINKDSGHHPACCCLLWSVLQLLLACDVTSPPPFPNPTLSSSPLIQWSFLVHKSECCHVMHWHLLVYF